MIYNTKSTPEIEELITAWQAYIATMDDWQKVVEGVTPKQTYCGPIYEPVSPLDRPNESFAVSDMRQVKVAQLHYHTGGETEVYFVLSGSGLTVVGGEETPIKTGDVIVTPPETAHFTIPKENLVMIVINAPPFKPENNIGIDESNPAVKYDHDQFKRILAALKDKQASPLADKLAKAATQVTVGARYVHYKQKNYKVIALALYEEDTDPCVVYKAEYGDELTWIRPVSKWLEEVEVDGRKVQRFTKL